MQWFRNQLIGRKLMFTFSLLCALTVFVGVIGIAQTKRINNMTSAMYADRLVPVSELAECYQSVRRIRGGFLECITLPDPANRQNAREALDEAEATINKQLEEYKKSNLTEKEKEALQEFEDKWDAYPAGRDRILGLVDAGKKAEALALYEKVAIPAARQREDALKNLLSVQAEEGKALFEESAGAYNAALRMILGITLLAFVLCIFAGFVLTNMIATPLCRLIAKMDVIADGNLTIQAVYDSKDEIGRIAAS
ncbi:MAG TPA: methyl-accepting chemotaxis protein, partial [Armatimonadota bacterium]|nr:methyl-accepting chemotaxis protein [Armatimonadota bacterium]